MRGVLVLESSSTAFMSRTGGSTNLGVRTKTTIEEDDDDDDDDDQLQQLSYRKK